MRKLTVSMIVGALLSVAASVSANTATLETMVVAVGPATIKVVEIGLPPAKQHAGSVAQSGK